MNQNSTEQLIGHALERLADTEIADRIPLAAQCWAVGGEPVSVETALKAQYRPISLGDRWGVAWDTVWFEFRGTVPALWAGSPVVALVELGGPASESFGWEGLVWRDGKPWRALGGFRNDIPLYEQARGSEDVRILVEGAASINAPRHRTQPVDGVDVGGELLFDLRRAELVRVVPGRANILRKWRLCLALMRQFGSADPRRALLRTVMEPAATRAHTHGWDAAHEIAVTLDRALKSLGNAHLPHHTVAVGHCHIDTAWCWPVRESVRKCARSFSTALRYMEEYPEYTFAASQALHYEWMRERYPAVWDGIQAAVKRGQWEVLAGMWVEPDTSVPCGESLVRQVVRAQAWVREHFATTVRVLWLPDVFGYSAALPQIMAQSGFEYFFTQKLSWNTTNRMPHHTFWWEGIDGTRVLTHFPPSDTYGGDASPAQIADAVTRFADNGVSPHSLYAYGHGDGGGGPTRDMIESISGLSKLGGMPRLSHGTVHTFFDTIRDEHPKLSVWTGELYLETHRGTLTTGGALKKGNREAESALRQAEFMLALVRMLKLADPGVERDRLDSLRRAWDLTLLNQFHDILPGTSIPWVTAEAVRDFGQARAIAQQVRDECCDALAGRLPQRDPAKYLWCINASGFDFNGVADSPDGPEWCSVAAWGWAPVARRSELPASVAPVTVVRDGNTVTLDNGLLRATIGASGALTSLYDYRTQRQVIAPGQRANVLRLHVDRPNSSDAWDIDPEYRLMANELADARSVEISQNHPMRATVRVVHEFGTSRLTQHIVLRAGSPRIDFETEVDWHEEHTLLRAYFACNVHSSRASHGIQYGHIERPTHANTSWDAAKFECGGQRWVDLSEHGFGVAVLDNGKYGRSVEGNVVGLSLLRAPRSPDPVMDIGHHAFTYAMLPHCGDLCRGRVIEQATELNQPLVWREWRGADGTLPDTAGWFSSRGVVVDWVKPAERSDGVVVRAFEAFGGGADARIITQLPHAHATFVSLLEEPQNQELTAGRFAAPAFSLRSVLYRT